MTDANSIHREHGIDHLRAVLDLAPPPIRLAPVRSRVKFERTSTTTIMSTRYPPLRAIVAGYLYEGFTVLAGRQKLGKTWLGIDWAVAVAIGGIAMGSIPCDQGDVLYIDMENGPRRIQGRINRCFRTNAISRICLGWSG